jgi:Tfp pilus assembly PilM family ATPase
MAAELAERRGIALTEARALLAATDLTAPEEGALQAVVAAVEADMDEAPVTGAEAPADSEDQDAQEDDMSYSEMSSAEQAPPEQAPQAPSEEDVRLVLDNGIREIAGEVRNSLDFHRSQEGGGEVSRVVLSGSALDLPGFAEALQAQLGIEVHAETVRLADESMAGTVSTHRLAIAAGLAATEVHQ